MNTKRVGLFAMGWIVACLLAGCHHFPLHPGEDADSAPETAEGGDDTDAPLSANALAHSHLAGSMWIRELRDVSTSVAPDEPNRRWRHRGLDDLLGDAACSDAMLESFLEDDSQVVVGNAAIGLARRGDGSVTDLLEAAATSPTLEFPMRRAAIEALGELPSPQALDALDRLLRRYGRVSNRQGAYNPELHAEILHALARRTTPDRHEGFLEGLSSPSSEVRTAALSAWIAHRDVAIPEQVVQLRSDRDAELRAASLKVLSRSDHPRAESQLVLGLRDSMIEVRLAAVAGLGMRSSTESRDILERIAQDPSEKMRSAAVAALAVRGLWPRVVQAAGDTSWRVRRTVADNLATMPSPDAETIASELLDDPSPLVQQAVVASVARWPPPRAAAILLEAMGKRPYRTRETAVESLAGMWPPAAAFPVDGTESERAQAIERLRDAVVRQYGRPLSEESSGLRPVGISTRAQRPTEIELQSAEEQIRTLASRDADALGRRQAAESLRGLGERLPEVLDTLATEQELILPESVYQEVLPTCDSIFAHLARLGGGDLAQRRAAAMDLAKLAGRQPVSELAWKRLAELGTRESDPVTLGRLLSAVAHDKTGATVELAHAATHHPSGEIRRLACEQLRRLPSREHVEVLLPLLGDADLSVARTSAQTLGLLGDQAAVEPLRKTLAARNPLLQVDAACALAKLEDPAGFAALERFSYSSKEEVRRNVAYAMGELADPTFAVHLVRMLDDKPHIARIASQSLVRVAGHEVAAPGVSLSLDQQRELWRQWFQSE